MTLGPQHSANPSIPQFRHGLDLGFTGLHVGTAFGIGDLMTRSPWVGGPVAVVEPACNTVALLPEHSTCTRRPGSGSSRDAAPEA